MCVGIGYCNDMFAFPSYAQHREQWYTALGNNIDPKTKKKINVKNRTITNWQHGTLIVVISKKTCRVNFDFASKRLTKTMTERFGKIPTILLQTIRWIATNIR
jgi:hypothetical protein